MGWWVAVAALAGAVAGALATLGALRWRRVGRGAAPGASGDTAETPARMARDIGVLAELLADQLAKLWQAGGGTSGPGRDGDAAYHHVRESTAHILQAAGASPKAATAVAALTAKKVRPGPIQGTRREAR